MDKKVVLITGASAGIGKDTAVRLLKDGCIVYATARRLDHMANLGALGATVLRMDVTSDAEVQAVVDQIIREQGHVDVLVNNAGFGLYGSVEEVDLEAAHYQLEVNLFGMARVSRAVIPHMRERRSGRIINVSSIGGKIYTPLGSWYHASKHAVEGWSDCLRLELRQFGIDVVIVEPGFILTEFVDVMITPMRKVSGSGPYANLVACIDKTLTHHCERTIGSQGRVIADAIARIVWARRPRTRYAVGKYATLAIGFRKCFGDRIYDKVMLTFIK